MKSLLIAVAILLTVIGTTVFGALCTDKRLANFSKEIEEAIPSDANDTAQIYENADEIEKEYNELKKYLILFIHDNGADEMEQHIQDIKSAAKSDSLADAMMAKSRLLLRIKQLRRLSKFGSEAVF